MLQRIKRGLLAVGSVLAGGAIFAQNIPQLNQTYPAGSANEITIPDPMPTGGSFGNNYYRVFTPWVKITDESQVGVYSSANDVGVITTFKDGSNHPIESVKRVPIAAGTTYLVKPYDTRINAGASYSLLPYSRMQDFSTTLNPVHSYNTISQQKTYYNNKFPNEGYTSYGASVNISDVNTRGNKILLPGKSQIGQNNGSITRKVANDANTIQMWQLDANGKPVVTGYYNANELFGQQMTNVSGEESSTFNDKDGKMIYKEIVVKKIPRTLAKTYYVYDDMGRLRYTIPPKAADIASGGSALTDEVLRNLCFSYLYDSKSRLSCIHFPGTDGNNYIVYDRFQRVAMRQNSVEKLQGKWEVAFYDKLGRPIGSSLLSSSGDRDYWQSRLDNPPGGLTAANIEYYLATDQGDGLCPSDGAVAGNDMMSFSYYDDYSSTLDAAGQLYGNYETEQAFAGDLLNTPGSEFPARSNRTFNLLTGERVRILKSTHAGPSVGDWRYQTFYYDDKARMIGAIVIDKLASDGSSGFRNAHYISTQYDFSDREILSKHTVIYPDEVGVATKHKELYKYEFEPGTGYFKTGSHKIDDGAWTVLSKYEYDDLGAVKRHIIGNYGEVQDMNYNIRGQLTGINEVYAESGNKQGESRTFGQSLKYDYGFNDLRLDGKISGMVWRGAGGTNANLMAYGYSYDDMGRLSTADFRKQTATGWSNTDLDYSVSNINYDIAGNILSMNQRGMVEDNGSIVPKDIDNLNYTYQANSHRLNSVLDNITTNYHVGDFVDNNTSGADYEYDANGNITKDLNKQIRQILYNHLNKPVAIGMNDGRQIEYSYDAHGNKIEQIFLNGPASKRVDHIGNFNYQNDSLQFILTPEGRTVYNPADTSLVEEFFVKDCLGNVRSVVDVKSYNLYRYLATFEQASANIEGIFFDHISEVSDVKPGSTDPNDRQAARLTGIEPDRRIGAAILMKVMAGDKIEMNVNNFYEGYNAEEDNPLQPDEMLSSIISTLTNGAGGFVGSESHNTKLVNQLFTPGNYINGFTQMISTTTDPNKPQSRLNYILFDETMKIDGFSGAFQANGEGAWTEIGTVAPLEIPRNGYLAIFLDNYSRQEVFYDLLNIRLSKGQLKEEVHYYPYGLPMANIGSAATGFKPNNYRYQSNENFASEGLDIMDFSYRQYDAQLGRFMSVDPLSFKSDMMGPYAAMNGNPISVIDPLGLKGDEIDKMVDNWLHFWLDEVVIYGNGNTDIIKNPGGGDAPFAPYKPGKNGWGNGAGGGTTNQYNGEGGGGSGHGSPDGNRLTDGQDTPGSPTGMQQGEPDGNGTQVSEDGYNVSNPGNVAGDEDGHEGGTPDGWFPYFWLNATHNILAVASLVPGVGEVAAGVDALLYISQGEFKNAAFSALGAIPGAALFGKGAKEAEVAVKQISREEKVIGLGLDKDLVLHRGSGAITYKNAGWQQAGLTKVDWGRAAMDDGHFLTSFKEAAENADAIHFNVTSFDPAYVKPGITHFELNHIINQPALLQKTTFIQNGGEVFWNGSGFIK